MLGGRIGLGVEDTASRRHVLKLAGLDLAAVAHGIFVTQGALLDEGEDLHRFVGVHSESAAGSNHVVVDHAEGAVAHVFRIVVVREGEGVPRVEPAVVGVSAVGGTANHGRG